MKLIPLASLSTKAAAAAVVGLAAVGGTGTALVLQPAADTEIVADTEDETTTTTVEDPTTTTTTTEAPDTTTTTTTTVVDEESEDTEGTDEDEESEDTEGTEEDGESDESTDDGDAGPRNFGAMVREDARDGGVDGREISEMARARNQARKAERATPPAEEPTLEDENDLDSARAAGAERPERGRSADAPGRRR